MLYGRIEILILSFNPIIEFSLGKIFVSPSACVIFFVLESMKNLFVDIKKLTSEVTRSENKMYVISPCVDIKKVFVILNVPKTVI